MIPTVLYSDVFWIHRNGQRNPKSDFSDDFYFLSHGYVSVRVMARDWSTEKYCSRQFWNAVEREPVRLVSSIQKHGGSRGAAPLGGAGGQSPPQIFFFLKLKTFFLKIVWNVPEKIFIDIGRKKKFWSYFSLFRVYQIDHISKTKNRRIFLLFFPFYSAPFASSIRSEWFCIIYKKWVIKTEGRGGGGLHILNWEKTNCTFTSRKR